MFHVAGFLLVKPADSSGAGKFLHDKELNFQDHVDGFVGKVSNQLQVIKRPKKLIDTKSKIRPYNAYFLPCTF